MKRLHLALIFVLIALVSHSQTTYLIFGDSVKISNRTPNKGAELIVENHSKDTIGALYNYGQGRTRFVPVVLDVYTRNDSIFINKSGVEVFIALIGSNSGSFDSSLYYTKVQSDSRFQPIGDYTTSTQLNSKLNIVDTTGKWQPLGNYLVPSDTLNKWQPIGNYASITDLNSKLNISDTGTMLSPYLRSVNAFNGDYNLLTNKPIIPTDNTQISNGAGYINSSALSPYLLSSTAASTYATQSSLATTNSNVSANTTAIAGKLSTSGGEISGNLTIGKSDYVNSNGSEIISYGHSIVEGYNSTSSAYNFVNIFAKSYHCSVTNNGVSGSTLDDFLSYTVLPYTSSVRYVTIMYGINEAAYGWDTATYHTKYKRAIDTLIAEGYPLNKIILIQTPQYSYANVQPFAYVDSLTALEKGVRFVPLYWYCVANNYKSYLNDGTHPLDAGHNFIAQRMLTYLNDADITGSSSSTNINNSFVRTDVLTATSGGFAREAMIDRMFIGNYGDSTSTYFGFRAPKNVSGILGNSTVGALAGNSLTTGGFNTANGALALQLNSTSFGNTAFGYKSLNITTGGSNTAMGYQSGFHNTTGASNIFIGRDVEGPVIQQDNKLYISNINDSIKSFLYGDMTAGSRSLTVNGTLSITPAQTTNYPLLLNWNSTSNLRVGDIIGVGTVSFHATSSPTNLNYFLRSDGSNAMINAPNASDFLYLRVGGGGTGQIKLDSKGKLYFDATNTATGTTGNQTINKSDGSVNFAAGAQSLTVTNSAVTTSSHVFCQIESDDATAKSCIVTISSGSFTIKLNAAATAELKVSFWVRD